MESNYPRLSIIIVSYNTKVVTETCLKSLYSAKWKDNYEVIVIDNNSKDGSVEMIKEKFPQVKLIANTDNKLFAIANNQGAKIAKGEYLLLLNSDTLIYDNNIQKMIDFLEQQSENVICIGPKILNKDKTVQSYGAPKYGLTEHFIKQMAIHKFFPMVGKIWKTLPYSPDVTHEVGWVSGSCMMIPRYLYEKVGGLNEKLEFYGEEPEFGYRTQKLGYKTLYYHEAEIIHLGGQSTKNVGSMDLETNLRRYDCLVRLTNGYKTAIKVTKLTILANQIKWILEYKNRDVFSKNIQHERKVVKFLRERKKGKSFDEAISNVIK